MPASEPALRRLVQAIAAAAWQAEIVRKLIALGGDDRARNRRGAEPLHYAVDGVPGSHRWNPTAKALLDGGADVRRKNKSGSTPMQLAAWNTGRGASGSPEAKAQQEEIVRLLRHR